MTQSIQLAALPEGMLKTDNSNQGSDKAKQGVINKPSKMVILLTILLVVFFTLYIVEKCRQPVATQYFCADEWIGFQDNCYYFSKQEGDWNSSRYHCFTQDADLTVIDTIEVMNFLGRHKCTSDHWIGLRMTENQTREWVNGTIFNNWFDVKGNGKCAYLGDDGIATARCYTERKWICRGKKGTRGKNMTQQTT